MLPLMLSGSEVNLSSWTAYNEEKEIVIVSDDSQKVFAFRLKDE